MVNRHGRHCSFRLIRPNARRAYLVGDFNNWSSTAIAMQRRDHGVWQTSLELPPGTYRFRYFVDGHWQTDFAAFGIERNRNGEWDSILYIPADASASDRTSTRPTPIVDSPSARRPIGSA
jgi:1,4-alpha-glucan branching enzyme